MKKIIVLFLIVFLVGVGAVATLWKQNPTNKNNSTLVSGSDNSAVGFFYFGGYEQLDPALFKTAYVRVGIDWNDFEPQEGNFVFDQQNSQALKIDQLLAEGKKIVPSIRSRSLWAVPKTKEKCASSPIDLNTKMALKKGVSYSDTYYNFVKNIAEHYKGKFEIVVIENEMNDNDFWCSSANDYLRLFLTAKKAFEDVDPAVKLADGGIQGAALNWLVIEDYLENQNVAATSFYEKFTGEQITKTELVKESKKHTLKEWVKPAQQLFDSQLFEWVDVFNFHYYQKPEALPEIVAYLRKNIPPGKMLMTNEVGMKERFSNSPDAASQEMIKKYAYLLSLKVNPILWFSPGGKEDNNAGALIDEKGQIVEETKNYFEAVARFLGKNGTACQDVSTLEVAKFTCQNQTEKVDVLWAKNKNSSTKIKIEPNCSVYNHQNQDITSAEVSLTTEPIFIVCSLP